LTLTIIGHRSLPHRRFEPLQITHRPLVEFLAVIVGMASCCMPEFFSISCNHVSVIFLVVRVWEKVNFRLLYDDG